MDSDDFRTFERALRRVSGAFRLKLSGEEFSELARTYFRLLEIHPLGLVLDAGKRLLATSRRFPLAVDWLAAIERPNVSADHRQMGAGELAEFEAAALGNFAGPVCGCQECRTASADREIRFVPTIRTAEDYETAYNPQRQRVQIVGHWAHGYELAAWYAARAEFFGLAHRFTVYEAAAKIFVREDRPREPGEEG